MKSIHLRFEDEDYEKLQQIAAEKGATMNGYLTKKILHSGLDSDLKSNKKLLEINTTLSQIHQDMCDILSEISNIKSSTDDAIFALENNENITQDSINNLSVANHDLKKYMVKSLTEIQKKLNRIKPIK